MKRQLTIKEIMRTPVADLTATEIMRELTHSQIPTPELLARKEALRKRLATLR